MCEVRCDVVDQRALKENVIHCRVDEFTFRKVMAIAKDNNTTMSDVVRLCVSFSLDQIAEVLKKSNALRGGEAPR